MTEQDVEIPATEAPAEAVVEAAPPAPPPTDEDVRTSRALADIARRERAYREQVASFESQRSELMTAKQRAEEYDSLSARLKADPTEALRLLEQSGHSFQALVDRVIERDTPEAKLEGLRKEFSEYKQSQEEKIRAENERAASTAQAQAIADFQSQQKSFIASHEDDYPLISAIGGTKLLYDIVDAHFQETGNVMSHKEAADRLEQTYFDNLSKLKTSEKVAKKLGIIVPVEKMSQVTLTNGRTGGAAPTETTGKKIWTAEEARDAALAKIRGTAAKT